MKLIPAGDHKLPTGALGLAIPPEGDQAFVSCADGGIYRVDLASGAFEALEEPPLKPKRPQSESLR